MQLNLENKTALVTGSYRGTGLIIARQLLHEGARVWVHGLDDGQAEAAVAQLGGGIPVTGNIATVEGCERVFTTLAQHTSSEASEASEVCGVIPDILINNYGTAEPGSWSKSSNEDWLDAFEKNVMSAQRLIAHWLPQMRQRGWGRIINLGTVGSTRPNSRMPHYYAAKGALATMTVSLAKEVAGTDIRVNLVSPGLILTPEVQAAYLKSGQARGWGDTWEEIEPRVAKDIPIGRINTREEVADLVTFLASPRAEGIHGQNIKIDGGSLGIVL